jgi:hypothetical protein
MDDIFLPEEDYTEDSVPVEFERASIEKASQPATPAHPAGVNASAYVKVTFGRFVALVANHSFNEVVERNQDEEVILSTNLLTDLANARRFAPSTRGSVMVLGGVLLGILFGYFLF